VQNVTDPDVLQILHQIACDLAEIKALVQPKAKKPAPVKQQDLSDADWLTSLRTNPAYAGINIETEYEKMKVWCAANHKLPGRRRFINWLNRVERPMQVQAQKKDLPPVMYRKVEAPKQGEDAPPEVKEKLSRLLGRDFMRMA